MSLSAGIRPSHFGVVVDVAWHYLSEYGSPLVDPQSAITGTTLMFLGNALLMSGRLGCRLEMNAMTTTEVGLTVRTPVDLAFREYAGIRIPPTLRLDTHADFAGEKLPRLISGYLRVTF